MTEILELFAAVFGVAGTFLLAHNGSRAGWGFVAYLGSNAGWLAFAWSHAHWALFGQQVAFTAASLLGIWRWLVLPRRATFMAVYRASRPYRGRIGSARLAWRCSR
jgi:hypothetical protein